MSREAFTRIMARLNEASAAADGAAKPAKRHVPAEVDVRGIRAKLRLSQHDFAYAFGVSVSQIKDWEQGRSTPPGALRACLMIIDRAPTAVLTILHAASHGAKAS